ncbi:homeobox protein HMX3-B-like [Hydractinia symbiolongicarpus]|uniref:homeobox protein HMX3-B-like n=1 Tax=Hydractinia symbiolongicarpus TaxID=13093 RepID=UPI00254F98E4|nr:homeobox protein HMX3-B-like [Hydractinia symbiolongicarpus]
MAKGLTDFSIAAILQLSDQRVPSYEDEQTMVERERSEKSFINTKEEQGEDCGSPDRKKKTRTVFTRQQIQRLENAFDRKKYFTNSERQKLAGDLLLSETQVKIWLQNRRNKWKKQLCHTNHSSNVSYHSMIPNITRDVASKDRNYPLYARTDLSPYEARSKIFL